MSTSAKYSRFPVHTMSTSKTLSPVFFTIVGIFLLFQTAWATGHSGLGHKTLLPIRQNGKYGFINSEGKIVIPARFYWAWQFHEDRALVFVCGKYGFIDDSGNLVIPARFDQVGGAFVQGLAPIRIGRKWGFIDKEGRIAIPAKFNDVGDFSVDGLARVEIKGGWGYIDRRGRIVIQPRFHEVRPFSEGLASVQAGADAKWGFINVMGKQVIPPSFDNALEFSEGLAAVKQGDKWSYVDKTGRITITTQFQFVGDFSEGLALIIDFDGEFGFVDRSGKTIIEPHFDFAAPFEGGVAIASADGKVGYIDRTGKWRSLPRPGGFDFAADGFAAVEDMKGSVTGDEWGYMDRQGKFIWRAPVTEAPTHEMWPIFGFSEEQRKQEIKKSCE